MNPADLALQIMDDLRACLCTRLTELAAPVCSCALVAGAQALPDACSCKGDKCGMAWVRLDRIYPSKAFPIQDQTGAPCDGPLAAVIEVGILRCVPTLSSTGQPPDAVQMTQAAIDAARDTGAMLTALQCCEAIEKRQHVLGLYQARDAGDCGGGAWQITVQLRRVA